MNIDRPLDQTDRARAEQARVLAVVARARSNNALLRLGACAVVTAVAMSVVGTTLPLIWFAGFVAVMLTDRAVHRWLFKRSEAGDPPKKLGGLLAWTVFQSAYGNLLAVILWFSPYVPGETLATFYLCGSLANAAATLRASNSFSLAGATPTVVFMLGLPVADYVLGGMDNPLDLHPFVAAALLLAFGVNVWRSLRASDAAQAEAQAAAARERQAAAAAAAAKTDVIRRMNDELRTPMAALIGAAEHLRRAAATPQARAHIATLVQAGEVLKLVLDDLSDLDRLENGQLKIDAKPADPREIARGVVSAFRAAAQDKQLELFLDVAPETPTLALMDAVRVRQVLFNVLANAVRYTAHGGVRVRVDAQASENPGAVRLVFTIADTGAGMSRSQLLLSFGRGRVGEGPGLGLAISLRLAKLMGGQLTAQSELGEGTVVAFVLEAPLAAREQAA